MTAAAEFWRRFRRNLGAVFGLAVLLAIVLVAIGGPVLYPVDPFDMMGRPNQLPSARFPLGTDVSGRDILAGLLNGARVSLLIGLCASLAATAIGLLVGGVAGYYGGWLDIVLKRTTDFFLTIPSFVLAVVIDTLIMLLGKALTPWTRASRATRPARQKAGAAA